METRRGWIVIAGVVVLVAGLVAAAYWIGASSGSDEPSASPRSSAPAPESSAEAAPSSGLPTPENGEPATDPIEAARAWLVNFRSVAWDDPTPTAWIDRVRPYVTDALAAEYEALREGGVGAEWEIFVERKCTSTVPDADGVIPPEAPASETAVYVNVSGTVTTACEDGEPPTPKVDAGGTIELMRGEDGYWRVNQRLY